MLPGWFQTYVGLEGAASLIRIYEVQFVHGLLQTEAYAHAVVTAGHAGRAAEDEIERRVALRLERQKLLLGRERPAVPLRPRRGRAAPPVRRPRGDATASCSI